MGSDAPSRCHPNGCFQQPIRARVTCTMLKRGIGPAGTGSALSSGRICSPCSPRRGLESAVLEMDDFQARAVVMSLRRGFVPSTGSVEEQAAGSVLFPTVFRLEEGRVGEEG